MLVRVKDTASNDNVALFIRTTLSDKTDIINDYIIGKIFAVTLIDRENYSLSMNDRSVAIFNRECIEILSDVEMLDTIDKSVMKECVSASTKIILDRMSTITYRDVVICNSIELGWHKPTFHESIINKFAQDCNQTAVYNKILVRSIEELDNSQENRLDIRSRANMFYLTNDNKIGFWKLNRLISSLMFNRDMCDELVFLNRFTLVNVVFASEYQEKYAFKCKPSVLLRKEYTDNYIESKVNTYDIETFHHSFFAEKNYKLSVVKGVEISQWYDEDTYADNNSSNLSSSCMRYNSCQSFFGIYTRNKNVSMLICTNDEGLIGRAILWEGVSVQDSEEEICLMDRVYFSRENVLPVFQKWAKENNHWCKEKQDYDSYTFVNPESTEVKHLRLSIELDHSEFYEYPYCDTMYRLDGYTLSSGNCGGCGKELRATGGGWEGDNRVWVEHLDEYYNEDDVCWSSYHEQHIYSTYAIYSDYEGDYFFEDDDFLVSTEDCGYVCEENATYSDRDALYYAYAVFSNHYDSFISRGEGVYVNSEEDYVYAEDIVNVNGTKYIQGSDLHLEAIEKEEELCEVYSDTTTKIKIKTIELLTKIKSNV